MFPWSHGEKLIFLEFSRFGTQIEGRQNTVSTTTLSDFKSLSSDSKDGCDGDGNYSAFMAITLVYSKEELRELNEELSEHTDVEEDEVWDDEEVYLDEGDKKLQVVYDALLEDCGKYAKVAKSMVKKMKRIEENHCWEI